MSSKMLAAYCHYCRDFDGATSARSNKELIVHYELRTCPRPTLRKAKEGDNIHEIVEGNDSSFSSDSTEKYCYPPGTVLIQTIAASICGSDLFGIGGCQSSPEWRRPTDLFEVMQDRCGGSGHEVIGRIIDMVPPASSIREVKNKNNLSVGQRVLAMPSTYLKRVTSMQEAFEKETGLNVHKVFPEETGAFCEYFISHKCVCLPLPECVPNDSFNWFWYVWNFYTFVFPLRKVVLPSFSIASCFHPRIGM